MEFVGSQETVGRSQRPFQRSRPLLERSKPLFGRSAGKSGSAELYSNTPLLQYSISQMLDVKIQVVL